MIANKGPRLALHKVKIVIPIHIFEVKKLTFYEPDFKKFPCLELAYNSLKIKKSAPTILNAANEVAVDAFLSGKIKYLSIPKFFVIISFRELHFQI